MTAAAAVILAVATELAKQAKDSLPELRKNEVVLREWLEDGIYGRETSLNGEVFLTQFNFRQKECHQWRQQ